MVDYMEMSLMVIRTLQFFFYKSVEKRDTYGNIACSALIFFSSSIPTMSNVNPSDE